MNVLKICRSAGINNKMLNLKLFFLTSQQEVCGAKLLRCSSDVTAGLAFQMLFCLGRVFVCVGFFQPALVLLTTAF